MRICFISRRFFPAISGMSVYAANLLRELVRMDHDVTMVSQYRGDERGTKVYGGGPPPAVPGVKVIGLQALGEELQQAEISFRPLPISNAFHSPAMRPIVADFAAIAVACGGFGVRADDEASFRDALATAFGPDRGDKPMLIEVATAPLAMPHGTI